MRGKFNPKANLVLKNVALISFDGQDIIATNQSNPFDPASADPNDPQLNALNTIDSGGPASAVDPLPAVTDAASFLVSWSGVDDVGGVTYEHDGKGWKVAKD